MSDTGKNLKRYRCPMCFMKEIDVVFLSYDAKEGEYYCKQCAYAGREEEVQLAFSAFTQLKYKECKKPHPFLETPVPEQEALD
jgi:hypothetical protein